MSALQKLKAYFGMVPAEDEDYDPDGYRDYDGYDGYGGYDPGDRYGGDYEDGDPEAYAGRGRGSAPGRPTSRYRVMEEFEDVAPAARRRGRGAAEPAVHGSLAVDRRPEPVARLHPVPEDARASARESARDPMSRITTLHPTTYVEARAVGEHYRDGIPVIINLTEMENADAKRVVDFAAGLAFALHGELDKVTSKVFLLSPPDVDVTAEDCKRIAEGRLFMRS